MSSLLTGAWFPIARLLRPQGRRGELLAEPLSDLPGLFERDREVLLADEKTAIPQPNATSRHIEDHWVPSGKKAGLIVLKLSGCDSISAAEVLAGCTLLISSKDLPALDPDTFFVGDLTGCTVFNSTPSAAANSPNPPRRVGTVTGIEFITTPDGRIRLQDAAPLLSVETTPGADPVLIPFVQAWIDAIDIQAQRITMHLPDGLLDLPETPSQDPSVSP